MPHWCLNGLEVSGPNNDVQSFSVWAGGEERIYGSTAEESRLSPLSFQRLVPSLEASARNAMGDILGGVRHQRIVTREEGRITYTFESVAIPPVALLKQVSREFPSLTFQLAFAEPCKDLRGLICVQQGRVVAEGLPRLLYPPVKQDHDDDAAFEEAVEAYLSAYGDHVWDLVRPVPHPRR